LQQAADDTRSLKAFPLPIKKYGRTFQIGASLAANVVDDESKGTLCRLVLGSLSDCISTSVILADQILRFWLYLGLSANRGAGADLRSHP
jgi:hypothetical protein